MRRKGQQAENDKTERVTGIDRRTREEIAKWNQMTALRFQTGGRHQTSLASLRGAKSARPQQNLHHDACEVVYISLTCASALTGTKKSIQQHGTKSMSTAKTLVESQGSQTLTV